MKNQQISYVARAALACGCLYYAQDLSRGDRHLIDWMVLGLVTAAIVWNLVQLGRRLYRARGGRSLWHLQRTVLFWILGLLNTALIRAEDVGSWKHGLGYLLLAIAAIDTVALGVVEHRIGVASSEGLGDRAPHG